MRFDTLEYKVGDLPEDPQTLVINRLGQARFASHTNRRTIDRPEIGLYEMVLPAEEVTALVSLMEDPPFKTLPDHWGRVLSGDRYRRIRVVEGAETVEKLIGTREAVDPTLQAVIDRLDRLVDAVEQHPRKTLRIELADPAVTADGDLTATLTLSGTGSLTAVVRHPAALLNAPDGRLVFQLWPDGSDARDLFLVAVDRVTERKDAGESPDDSAVLELPTGQAVAFRVHAAPGELEAGPYRCRIAYATFTGEVEDQRVLTGEVFSRNVPVAIE